MKRIIISILACLTVVTYSHAQEKMVCQTVVDPFPVTPERYTQLIATGAAYSATLKERAPASNFDAKQFWIEQWSDEDQRIEWQVDTPLGGDYRVVLLINSDKDEHIRISSGCAEVLYITKESGWQRVKVEQPLTLAEGVGTISLSLGKSSSRGLSIKAVEIYAISEEESINHRIEEFKADPAWMQESGYGVMVQSGGWSYPPSGDKKPWPAFAEEFDAQEFVEKIDEMGARFLVWSATWSAYYFPAPIDAIAQILPERVSDRDLIGDLIKECKKRDIRFMLYYHSGHGEREIFEAKGWRDDWISAGGRDKSSWIDMEIEIFKEVGARYGDGLDAIFIDGGMVWYPTDFETLGAALRTGNSDRLICYNSWVVSQYTPFQDFYCGEGFNGEKVQWRLKDGIFAEGPQKGLQCWGCSIFDGPNWGINSPNVVADSPKWSIESLVSHVKSMESAHFSVAFNLLLYEDGTIAQDSYQVLREVAKELKRGSWGR